MLYDEFKKIFLYFKMFKHTTFEVAFLYKTIETKGFGCF